MRRQFSNPLRSGCGGLIPAALAGFAWLAFAALPPAARAIDRPPSDKPGVGGESRIPDSLRIVPRPPHRALDVRIWTDRTRYEIGDDVRVYFRVDRDARVYIFNTDAAGLTRQLFPSAYDRDNYVNGGVTYSIPDANYRLVATGPTGWESLRIVAYASRHIYFQEYHKFDMDKAPFPARPSGAEPLLRTLESQGVEPADEKPLPEGELKEMETGRGAKAKGEREDEEKPEGGAEARDERERPARRRASETDPAARKDSAETARKDRETSPDTEREGAGLRLQPVHPEPGHIRIIPAPRYGEDVTTIYIGPSFPRVPFYDDYDYPPYYPTPRRYYYYDYDYRSRDPYVPHRPRPYQPRLDPTWPPYPRHEFPRDRRDDPPSPPERTHPPARPTYPPPPSSIPDSPRPGDYPALPRSHPEGSGRGDAPSPGLEPGSRWVPDAKDLQVDRSGSGKSRRTDKRSID